VSPPCELNVKSRVTADHCRRKLICFADDDVADLSDLEWGGSVLRPRQAVQAVSVGEHLGMTGGTTAAITIDRDALNGHPPGWRDFEHQARQGVVGHDLRLGSGSRRTAARRSSHSPSCRPARRLPFVSRARKRAANACTGGIGRHRRARMSWWFCEEQRAIRMGGLHCSCSGSPTPSRARSGQRRHRKNSRSSTRLSLSP
jgi:hypothetical protein